MPGILERLQELAADKKARIPAYLEQNQQDLTGSAALFRLQMIERFLAVADYVATKEVAMFRTHLQAAARCQIELFNRIRSGGKICPSLAGPSKFKEVLTALASGDLLLAYELVGNLKKTGFERSAAFNKYFVLLFCAFILEDSSHEETRQYIEKMKAIFAEHYKSWLGYPLVFEAIFEEDGTNLQEALEVIMKGHKLLCRTGNEFGDSVDEVIAILPLGMINLARFKGLKVNFDHPLIPHDLILSDAEVQQQLEALKHFDWSPVPLHPRLIAQNKVREVLEAKKAPSWLVDIFLHLMEEDGGNTMRPFIVRMFNNKKEYKTFLKYIKDVPEELIDKLVDALLSKSSFHAPQCEEVYKILGRPTSLTKQ